MHSLLYGCSSYHRSIQGCTWLSVPVHTAINQVTRLKVTVTAALPGLLLRASELPCLAEGEGRRGESEWGEGIPIQWVLREGGDRIQGMHFTPQLSKDELCASAQGRTQASSLKSKVTRPGCGSEQHSDCQVGLTRSKQPSNPAPLTPSQRSCVLASC
jgi:hypothetical protein